MATMLQIKPVSYILIKEGDTQLLFIFSLGPVKQYTRQESIYGTPVLQST